MFLKLEIWWPINSNNWYHCLMFQIKLSSTFSKIVQICCNLPHCLFLTNWLIAPNITPILFMFPKFPKFPNDPKTILSTNVEKWSPIGGVILVPTLVVSYTVCPPKIRLFMFPKFPKLPNDPRLSSPPMLKKEVQKVYWFLHWLFHTPIVPKICLLMFPKFPKFARDPRLSSPPMLKMKLNMLEKN